MMARLAARRSASTPAFLRLFEPNDQYAPYLNPYLRLKIGQSLQLPMALDVLHKRPTTALEEPLGRQRVTIGKRARRLHRPIVSAPIAAQLIGALAAITSIDGILPSIHRPALGKRQRPPTRDGV